MTEIILRPGDVTLAEWRAIYRGASARLDAAAAGPIAASAAAVTRILAKGEPVYGINTGFGKLASVRIGDDDLATLQRNIVLSHAAGVGAPTPIAVTRLMLALKLGSLAQGASGVAPATIALLEALLARGLTPVVPGQGSVGASGALARLAASNNARARPSTSSSLRHAVRRSRRQPLMIARCAPQTGCVSASSRRCVSPRWAARGSDFGALPNSMA